MNLVVLPFRAKPWAFLLDYSVQELESATLLEVTKLTTLRRPSKMRVMLQEKLASSKCFNTVKLGKLKSLLSAVLDLRSAFFQYRKGHEIIQKQSLQRLDDIVHCRLSAYLGDRYHDKSKVPFLQFSKFYLVTHRTLNELNNFLRNSNGKFSRIIVYNGREPLEASCIRLARTFGLRVTIIEKGSNNSRYQVFDNSPHYHPDWWALISRFRLSPRIDLELAERNRVAYLNAKLSGIDPYFHESWSKTADVVTTSPDIVDENTILYFSSSSAEFSPFSCFNYDVGYLSQYQAVEELIQEAMRAGLRIVIRRHPNSVGVDGIDREAHKWTETLSKFAKEDVNYVGPDEAFDTYASIRKCKMVFVWKSSIGFEALALGKPAYALATAKWSWDPKLRCWSRYEIKAALIQTLEASIADNVVSLYSNFMANSGTDCKTFKTVAKWGIRTIDGQVIYNGKFEKFFQVMEYKFPRFFGRRKKSNYPK